jgi:glycosyltransferase involved in cell wall biosynthesis
MPEPFSGKTILCLGTQEWDAHWTPAQQVMLRLASQNQVVYVEPFHPPFAWLKTGNGQLKELRKRHLPRLRQLKETLWIYRPACIYFPGNMACSFSARLNAPRYKAEIGRLLKQVGFRKPWLWAFFAQSLSVLEIEFDHFIYDCVDDWVSFFHQPSERQFVAHVDEILCRTAEIVFVGSQPLFEKKVKFNSETFVVNHAADVEHFQKAIRPETTIPPDLDRLARPRVGFVGMMDSVRFDDGLIRSLAKEPSFQVVLVGGCIGDAQDLLPRNSNVHWLGMKPVSELPAYLKGMDVCIMPYRLNEATRNIYPLKLHEYLATGKPIVATAIPAVEDFRQLIYVAENEAQFVESVRRATMESDPELSLRRQQCALQHSWEAHVSEKVRVIQHKLLPV